MTRRILLAIAIVVGVATLPAAAAAAAPGWTAPRSFALPANAYLPSVVIAYGPGGTATVAYFDLISQSPPVTTLHIGVIPPGRTYHDELQVPTTSTAIPLNPEISEAPNGATVVAWPVYENQSGTLAAYQATYRQAGHSGWSAPTYLETNTPTGSASGTGLVTAIGPDGTAAVGIDRYDPDVVPINGSDHDTNMADVVVHGPRGGWGVPTTLNPPGVSGSDLGLGVDAHGNVTAALRLKLGNGRHTVASLRRPSSNGIWGSVEDLTGSDVTSDVFVPKLAVAPNGSAVIAFQYVHYAAPNTLDVTALTRVGAGGAWGAPADTALGGASSAPQAVGIAPNGEAYVMYTFQGSNSAFSCEGVARAQAGTAFPSSPRCLSPANFQNATALGVGFLGNDAYLSWLGQPNAGAQWVVQASRWANGAASPDVPTNLDSPTNAVVGHFVQPDQQGGVATFWQTTQTQLSVAAFDAGGPSVVAASVPAKTRVGHKNTLSITVADLWSGVAGRPVWNFGDHSSATGTRVHHTYRKPGRYTIRVTSRDRLGNLRTVTYRILVTRH